MTDRPRPSGRVPRPGTVQLRGPTVADVSAQVTALSVTTGQLANGMGILEQRLGGTEERLGQRIDGLAEEVSLLRQTQVTDHAPRLLAVEQQGFARSLAHRAGGVLAGGLRLGSYGTLIAVAGRLAAKQWPEFGEAIEGVLGALGL